MTPEKDLVWHAHMLSGGAYETDMFTLTGKLWFHEPWPETADGEEGALTLLPLGRQCALFEESDEESARAFEDMKRERKERAARARAQFGKLWQHLFPGP